MKTKMRLILFLILASSWAYGQVDPINGAGTAIGGYDVVSYFKAGKAAKGSDKFVSIYGSAKYYFVSADNKKQFDKDPSLYVPQFDGYCALAVSYGKKLSIDPETFKVIDDKLYLFYNGKTSNGKVNSLETWNRNEHKLLRKAVELWPDVSRTKYDSREGL